MRVERRYGTHPDQVGDLHLPAGEPPSWEWPVVVLLHGGFWRARYRRDLMTPLAEDLARRGIAAWKPEFRRVRSGGGWPATFLDVAAAVDHLAELSAAGAPIDLGRVVVLGHSAGGHLALWVAGRARLPAGTPGADPVVGVVGAVGLAPVADLRVADRVGLGDGAVHELLATVPAADRFSLTDPMGLVGHGLQVLVVHGTGDTDVPVELSEAYAEAGWRAGDPVVLRVVPAGHMELIDPASQPWIGTADWVVELLGGTPGARRSGP